MPICIFIVIRTYIYIYVNARGRFQPYMYVLEHTYMGVAFMSVHIVHEYYRIQTERRKNIQPITLHGKRLISEKICKKVIETYLCEIRPVYEN